MSDKELPVSIFQSGEEKKFVLEEMGKFQAMPPKERCVHRKKILKDVRRELGLGEQRPAQGATTAVESS